MFVLTRVGLGGQQREVINFPPSDKACDRSLTIIGLWGGENCSSPHLPPIVFPLHPTNSDSLNLQRLCLERWKERAEHPFLAKRIPATLMLLLKRALIDGEVLMVQGNAPRTESKNRILHSAAPSTSSFFLSSYFCCLRLMHPLPPSCHHWGAVEHHVNRVMCVFVCICVEEGDVTDLSKVLPPALTSASAPLL